MMININELLYKSPFIICLSDSISNNSNNNYVEIRNIAHLIPSCFITRSLSLVKISVLHKQEAIIELCIV